MKLIVLSPFVYYPGVPSGGGALCWGQLQGMGALHDVHFLSFVPPDSTELATALPHLESLCKSVTTVVQDLARQRVLLSKLALFTRLEPIVASLCLSDDMMKALKSLLAKVRPDAVMIQFPQMAQYVVACETTATVMDVQDAFSVSAYRRFRTAPNSLKKAIDLLSWLCWIRYESRWYARFTVVTTLTNQDSAGLEIFTPGLSAIDSPAGVVVPNVAWAPVLANTIAFIGSFAHPPNVDAVVFFIQQVLPLVLQDVPDAVMLVAGKGVPQSVKALAGPHVQFLGIVPDASLFLQSAAVTVIPLRSGGGIKIKTLEALASGCPIVATTIGAEETSALSGTHLLIADEAPDFARAVVSLLGDTTLAQRLGINGRKLAKDKFSWPAKHDSLNAVIDLAAERARARA